MADEGATMDWQKGRQSDNVVEDEGGGGGGFGGGGGMRFGGFHLGLGGTIIIVIIALVFPQTRPLIMNLFLSGGGDTTQQSAPAPTHTLTQEQRNDPQHQFVS